MGVPLAKALYGALDGFVREGRQQCFLDTGDSQFPDGEQRQIVFACSGKRLDLTVLTLPDGESASLAEIVRR